MNSKEEKIKNFDPNGISTNSNLFGLPFTTEEAEIVVFPVPWEVTVSYQSGTAQGPEAILNASAQVDLYDPAVSNAWKTGIAMDTISEEWMVKSNRLREKASRYIAALSEGVNADSTVLDEINAECKNLNNWVKNSCLQHLNKGKLVALLGGDHSTPLGFIQALAEKHPDFAILQIDAHADLRDAYEGFEFSHASIMFNALKIPQISKLVQVGIRDYCESEVNLIKASDRIVTFFDRDIKYQQYEGKTWKNTCDDICKNLPELLYISFDIDGLDPKLCPNTGTPVAGGLETEQVLYLIEAIVNSGKKIIGFDLNEVAPGEDEWDANVGARLLYRLANLMALSQNKTVN